MAWHLFDQVYMDAFDEDARVLRQAAEMYWHESSHYWQNRCIIDLMRISRDLLDLYDRRFKDPLSDLVRDKRVSIMTISPTQSGRPTVTLSNDPKLLWADNDHGLSERFFWEIVMRTTDDFNNQRLSPKE